MKSLPLQGRTMALLAAIVPLLALFIYVGLRSGPLAPVAVTVVTVESGAVTPALFGIGKVEARYTDKIGPTFAGRVKRLNLHVGDQVKAGQVSEGREWANGQALGIYFMRSALLKQAGFGARSATPFRSFMPIAGTFSAPIR